MKRSAILLLLITDVFFAIMAFLGKRVLSSNLPPAEVAFLRFLIGIVVVLFRAPFGASLQFNNFKILLLRGFLGGLSVFLYFTSIRGLPIGIASLLNYSWPIFAVFWSSLLLREKPSLFSAFSLVLAMVGITFVITGGATIKLPSMQGLEHTPLFYLCIGVLSSVVSAGAIVTIRAARQSVGHWELFLFFCIVGAFVTGIPTLFTWQSPSMIQWLYLLGVGLTSAVGQVCMTHALKDVTSLVGGLMMLLTPVMTFVIGIFLLSERINMISAMGSFLTLLGVALGMLAQSKTKPKVSSSSS